MAETNGFSVAKLWTDLVGRKVVFQPLATGIEPPLKQAFGIYQLLPSDARLVARADLALLGSMGGLLVGLPDNAVKDRIKTGVLDELLRDAVHEVLNVTAAVIWPEGRAVFQKMVFDRAMVDGEAGEVLRKPFVKSFYNVTVDGYQGGKFALFAQNLPNAVF